MYLDPCHKRPEQGVVHGFEIPVSWGYIRTCLGQWFRLRKENYLQTLVMTQIVMRVILGAGIAIPYTYVHINIYTHAQTYIHTYTLNIPHHPTTSPSPTQARDGSISRSRQLFNRMHITSAAVQGSIFCNVYLPLAYVKLSDSRYFQHF